MTDAIKYCADCKWFSRKDTPNQTDALMYGRCGRPRPLTGNALVHPDLARESLPYASVERDGNCGFSGQFFEPKVSA